MPQAAGVCGRAEGAHIMFSTSRDGVPSPRCSYGSLNQTLVIDNTLPTGVEVRLSTTVAPEPPVQDAVQASRGASSHHPMLRLIAGILAGAGCLCIDEMWRACGDLLGVRSRLAA
jgi:hypothetical protein